MIQLTPFPLTCTPYSGESLAGFIVRLAERLCWRDAAALAAAAGLTFPGCSVSRADLTSLAELSQVPVNVLSEMSYHPVERQEHRRFLGGQVHREFLIRHRRFCPHCLGESAYHRAEWDFALLATCPRHAVHILAECPKCQRRIQWKPPCIAKCACGQELADVRAMDASDADVLAAVRILGLATGGDHQWLPGILRSCDGADLVGTSMRLGMFLAGWRPRHSADTLISATTVQLADIVRKGTDCLAACPKDFHLFLRTRLCGAARRRGRYVEQEGIAKAFNDWLAGQVSGTT